jgi:hypothetical protein
MTACDVPLNIAHVHLFAISSAMGMYYVLCTKFH